MTKTKGVVVVRAENGEEKIYSRYIYLRMIRSGSKLELIEEADRVKHLRKIRGY